MNQNNKAYNYMYNILMADWDHANLKQIGIKIKKDKQLCSSATSLMKKKLIECG